MKIEKIISDVEAMGYEAHENTVDKGNGVILNAIVVRKPGEILGANVYYTTDESNEEIMKKIEAAIPQLEPEYEVETEKLGDWEYAKSRLTVRLYSQPPKGAVAIKVICDLFAVPTLVVRSEGDEMATAVINDGMLKSYGVTEDVLYEAALESAKEITTVICKSMYDTMVEMMGEEAKMFIPQDANDDKMYVLSNKQKINGASAILYAENLPFKDFYMLPSSKHEVLLLRMENETNEGGLSELVKQVNKEEVPAEDFLSDNAYCYKDGEWFIIG
jgi:hypothetical protein